MGIAVQDHDVGADVARIWLELPECRADAERIVVVVVDVDHGRSHRGEVRVPPSSSPERPRVVALGIAEALRQAWTAPATTHAADERLSALEQRMRSADDEHDRALSQLRLELTDAARTLDEANARLERDRREASSLSESARDPRRARVEARRRRAVLFASGSISGYLAGGAALLGASAGVDLPVGPLRLVIDTSFGLGNAATRVGDVGLAQVVGGVSLLAGLTVGSVSTGIGPVTRLGWARAQGDAFDPTRYIGHAADGLLFSLGGRVVTVAELTPRVLLFGDLEGGFEFVGIEARFEGERAVALKGPSIRFSLGLAYEL